MIKVFILCTLFLNYFPFVMFIKFIIVYGWLFLYVLLKIFFAFGSAMVKLRTSKLLGSKTFGIVNDDVGNSSAGYYMGQLLKESMLNLGPTFIKG